LDSEGECIVGFLDKIVKGKKGSVAKKAVATPKLKKAAVKAKPVARKTIAKGGKSRGK
jgi:hypothetical protein